jgi:hypothetical protein
MTQTSSSRKKKREAEARTAKGATGAPFRLNYRATRVWALREMNHR